MRCTRMSYQITVTVATLLAFLATLVHAESSAESKLSAADAVRSAAAEGKLAYMLTEPNELRGLLGPATNETMRNEDDGEILFLNYPDIRAVFVRRKGDNSNPFALVSVGSANEAFDIGQERQIVLRNEVDLKKFDTPGGFWRTGGVSLVNLDLRGYKELLEKIPFDSRTKWPRQDKMPEGFVPKELLEKGKNPGLGIRKLHQQGIDGRGVGIAIIDQPLLKEHTEYVDRIVLYEPIDVQAVPPQMHGPPVASIAVGKTCGIAPGATLYYYAVPAWKWNSCQPYCEALDKIIEFNKTLVDLKRIRVVSISTGMFSHWDDFSRWQEALKKANGHGILVVTCDSEFIRFGTLALIPNKDPDNSASYQRGRYSSDWDVLRIPAANRTTASHYGPDVYTCWREGGLSWAAPYLAGLAALAYQVNPKIQPDEIVKLWIETAVKTDAGLAVNPPGFIEAVQRGKLK